MGYEFDQAIAVTQRGEARYGVDFDAKWLIGPSINGGISLAAIANAISHQLGSHYPDPLALNGHYLSATSPGPAEVTVQVVRQGRRFATAFATLSQNVEGAAVTRTAVSATFGTLPDMPQPHAATAPTLAMPLTAPDVLPPHECVSVKDVPAEMLEFAPFMRQFKTCLEPDSVAWLQGHPTRRGLLQGWFRFGDDRPLDGLGLLLAVDSLPPVTLDLGMPGWAPTLELTAHIRARPEPGWAKIRHYTRTVEGSMFVQDCELWDAAGTLVAQSRQLALQPHHV